MVSVTGPFQSNGPGKLPDSDITFSVQAQGQKGNLQLISTGGHGYVEIDGVAYALPAADIKELKSGVSSVTGIGAGKGQSDRLGVQGAGIDPLGWLSSPTGVGHEQVGGAQTTHIHATVNATPMLRDLSRLLGKAEQLGINGGSSGVPQQHLQAHARQDRSRARPATFDVWTGTSDRTVRRLTVTGFAAGERLDLDHARRPDRRRRAALFSTRISTSTSRSRRLARSSRSAPCARSSTRSSTRSRRRSPPPHWAAAPRPPAPPAASIRSTASASRPPTAT